MNTLDEIRHAVLALPTEQRAALAHDLVASLEVQTTDADCEAAWAAESLSRSDAYRRGELAAHDWRESVQGVRQALEKQDHPS